MSQAVFFDETSVDWLGTPNDWEGKVDEGEPDVRYKVLVEGKDSVPGVQLVEFEPAHHEKAHSHPESEVLFVLDGEMTIGGRKVRAGAGVFIEKNTQYGPLDASDSGVRFLRVGLGSRS